MIKYLARSLPSSPWLRQYCLLNPEYLVILADLIAQTEGRRQEQLADQFSILLHDLRMGGSWKRTSRGRLKETERVLCAYLRAQPEAPAYWLDLGGSDGITTLEAVQSLRRTLGKDVHAFLADLHLWLLRYQRGPVSEYRACDGEPIMMRVGRVGLRLAKHRHELHHAIERLGQFYLKFGWLRRHMRFSAGISLINPLVSAEPAITVLKMDCLVRENHLVNRLAAIRASNILNLSYFTKAQILTAIGHLHAYLREAACLIISRNDGPIGAEVERGSVWFRRCCRFDHCEDFGGGSELRELVDGWKSAS